MIKKILFLFVIVAALGFSLFRIPEVPRNLQTSNLQDPTPPQQALPITESKKITRHPGMLDLASALRLTSHGETAFFETEPLYIVDKKRLREICSTEAEGGALLGCYHTLDHRIYILQIADQRLLSGILNTAGHELLHAVYAKIPAQEKEILKANLQMAISHNKEYFESRIKAYSITNQETLLDEAHSMFGTEVDILPKALEDHYRKYFRDRQYIVSKSQGFKSQFTKRTDQIKKYDDLIATYKFRIEQSRKTASSISQEFQMLSQNAELAKSQNQFEQYNNLVPELNRLAESLQTQNTQINNLIIEYNELVQRRNDYTHESNEFAASISTSQNN